MTANKFNYYDTKQLLYEDTAKITFVSQELQVFIFEEEWTTTTSSSGYIELLNYHGIGSSPTITLTLSSTYSSNPTLRIYNGSTCTDISLGTSVSATDNPLIINCEERYAKKNTAYFLPSHFPKIGNNEFFSVEFINNSVRTAVPISVYYKTHNSEIQIMKFKDSVSLQNVLNQVDIPKKYYNSPFRSKKIVSEEASIEFGRNIISDNIDQIVNNTKTYRIEVIGINEDDGTQKIYRIGNVVFNSFGVSILEADSVTDKISGTGVWL
jgi:hypothetical protein